MFSINEWDPLKKVIVGVADYAQIPKLDISLRTVNYADVKDEKTIPYGSYPTQVIEEANEDLETFCEFLTGEGVEVLRPEREPVEYYNYCPRDTVLIYGKTAIAAPMSLNCRKNEFRSMLHHLDDIYVAENYQGNDMFNLECLGNPDVLALNDIRPKFDAANIIRANDHLLYLVSNSGNKVGAQWLQDFLGDQVKVHTLEKVYSYMHIDSTVAFLREGLLLLNPSRIKDKNVLPEPFNKWDCIWCPEPVDIGHYPGYCNASKWINMNLFSVNPNLVALEKNQDNLRYELEKHGIECAMLPMRHQRTLGGGFHCVTLDIERYVV